MSPKDLDKRIFERGSLFFAYVKNQTPSLFNKNRWIGQIMDWSMRNKSFKINLFRFVDVFPSLKSSASLTRHVHEYFSEGENDIPQFLKLGLRAATYGGVLGAKFLNFFIAFNIKNMAKQFIIGETTVQAIKTLEQMRKHGFAFTIDLLGEATITEEEAEHHAITYFELLTAIAKRQIYWKPLPGEQLSSGFNKDWGYSPFSQFSIKLSALYSQINPADFENSVQAILLRLKKIYRKVIEIGGSLCIDMENHQLKSITLEVFRRLRSDPEFLAYSHLGIVLQAYLRDTTDDLGKLLAWARANDLPIEIRLVKGAYWDYEFITALQNNWEPPVWTNKSETDFAFEQLARKILENHDICYFACGSHNIRSIAAVIEIARELNVPEIYYEFQVLYGMAEPVRNALKDLVGRVRLYSPYGEMIPGMAYLVRRLLENTANESFLRQSFSEHVDMKSLLRNPKQVLDRNKK